MKTHKTIKYLTFVILLPLIINSCIFNNEDNNLGEFPTTPQNLMDFNTEYDDYNSTAPSFGETFPFCFSSNRNSIGNDYDIVFKMMTVEFSKDNRELEIFNNTNGNLDVVIENSNIAKALNKINTSSNEFGPYLIPRGRVESESSMNNRYESYLFMYSSENDGNQDILFTHNLDDESYTSPTKIEFINSEFDDAYPTFNEDLSKLFFTSNKEGNFNIYSNDTDNSIDLIESISEINSEPSKELNLSSDSDDICPFIIEDLMIFTSNRDGGFGGYDLYYSVWENDQWSAPINFGDKINSPDDEFRPIIRKQWDFTNDMMIFSSNRPGGKGGFDLYYVGVEQLME